MKDSPNILRDTAPRLDAARPGVASCVITDAWGLVFAQGGVVMAAALRAMEAVLGRADLALTAASATYCRPVPCGPVSIAVEVLRDGRRGAQVHAAVTDPGTPPGGTDVVLTAVFTDPHLPGPVLTPLERPDALATPPPAGARSELRSDPTFPLGFLDNTEWCLAAGDPGPTASAGSAGPPRSVTWFRFTDPPAGEGDPWDPALLVIPGDSLGSALSVALAGGDGPVGSVSLQIGIQVHAPARGTWIGIDSVCDHIGGGLATGTLHLWSEDGHHVATVAQTAMLRALG